MKLVKITTPVAKQEHICNCCGKVIKKGEQYSNYLYKTSRRKLERHYLHLDCHDVPSKEEQDTQMGGAIVRPVGPQFHQLPKTEEELKQIVKEDTNDMLQTFTFNEHMKIVFVPLVITEMAWSYADKVVQQAIDNRIPQTVKLTRTVKMLKEEYYKEIGKDLDKAHVDQIKTESKRFMEECARDLLIMRLQVNQSLKSKWYDLSYLDMRTDAYCCIVMLSLLEENEKVVKDIIMARTGNYVHVANPKIDALKDCMDAYVSPAEIDYSEHTKLSLKIMNKNLKKIEFNIK